MCNPDVTIITASFDWIKLLQGLSGPVSWALVIVGWFIVSRDHNRRVRRSEIRKVMDEMNVLIMQIESIARGYWLTDGAADTAKMAALNLKRQLKHLANKKNILQRTNEGFKLENSMKLFRQALTLGDFESRTRKALQDNDPRFDEINNFGVEFIDNIEASFERIYC